MLVEAIADGSCFVSERTLCAERMTKEVKNEKVGRQVHCERMFRLSGAEYPSLLT